MSQYCNISNDRLNLLSMQVSFLEIRKTKASKWVLVEKAKAISTKEPSSLLWHGLQGLHVGINFINGGWNGSNEDVRDWHRNWGILKTKSTYIQNIKDLRIYIQKFNIILPHVADRISTFMFLTAVIYLNEYGLNRWKTF